MLITSLAPAMAAAAPRPCGRPFASARRDAAALALRPRLLQRRRPPRPDLPYYFHSDQIIVRNIIVVSLAIASALAVLITTTGLTIDSFPFDFTAMALFGKIASTEVFCCLLAAFAAWLGRFGARRSLELGCRRNPLLAIVAPEGSQPLLVPSGFIDSIGR